MKRVIEKDIYTIDLRPYFIDLRKSFTIPEEITPEPVQAVMPTRPAKKVKKHGFARGVVEWAVYALIFITLVWGTPQALTAVLDSDYPIASITSSSMWPELKRGDIVFIEGVDDKSDLNLGDIVVFENKKGFTIHRVKKLNEKTLITKGDANNIDDAPVGYDKVVGRAVEWRDKTFKVPWIGKLSHTVQSVKDKMVNSVEAGG